MYTDEDGLLKNWKRKYLMLKWMVSGGKFNVFLKSWPSRSIKCKGLSLFVKKICQLFWSFLKPQRGAWGKRFNPPRQWVFTRCPFRHSYARISYVYDSTVALVNVWFLYPRAFYFWVTLLRYDRNISHLKLIMHILLLLRKQREYMHCEQRFANRSLNF